VRTNEQLRQIIPSPRPSFVGKIAPGPSQRPHVQAIGSVWAARISAC